LITTNIYLLPFISFPTPPPSRHPRLSPQIFPPPPHRGFWRGKASLILPLPLLGEYKRDGAPLPIPSPSPLKERGIKVVR